MENSHSPHKLKVNITQEILPVPANCFEFQINILPFINHVTLRIPRVKVENIFLQYQQLLIILRKPDFKP